MQIQNFKHTPRTIQKGKLMTRSPLNTAIEENSKIKEQR